MPPQDRILVMAHAFTKREIEKLSSPEEPLIRMIRLLARKLIKDKAIETDLKQDKKN